MEDDVPAVLGSTFSDILSSLDFSAAGIAGSIAGVTLARLLRRRAEVARNILLDEIKDGARPPRDSLEADEFVAVTYRYLQAASEGAAKSNLRLLAKVIRGKIENRTLYASDFLRFCPILASLSREEIAFLGALIRNISEFQGSTEGTPPHGTDKQMQAALIPSIFTDEDELHTTASALLRTNLLVVYSGWGGLTFRASKQLVHLAELADFEVSETEEWR